MSLNERSDKLMIFGPEGIDTSFQKALTMCYFNPRFDMEVYTISPGDRFKVGELNILAGEADHIIPSLAFRVFQDEKTGRFNRRKALNLGIPEGPLWGRLQRGETISFRHGTEEKTVTPDMVLGPPRSGLSVGYSGDTGPIPGMVELMKGVDVLIHEATFSTELEERAREYCHSTAAQAARIAKEAGAGKLCLVHSSPRYSKEGEEEVLLREAREIFHNVIMPEDLDCMDVTR
jgi:ribonuclease Z